MRVTRRLQPTGLMADNRKQEYPSISASILLNKSSAFMSDSAIRVDAVSKKFRRGRDPGYGRLSEVLQSLLFRSRSQAEDNFELRSDDEFWALQDLSFEVQQGEVFGIIGRNGAGKSTLLKILSRITRPTKGQICTRGRVGSLLEVGTGFHPELTGRENVYLNGSILGMSRREIAAKFDEIAAFAEVEQFLDTPVKRYSSGMYTRLAFSVAAHLEPEILIIDEVLAVGDAAFQKKCFGKMQQVAHAGRTVLFVSHNMSAVKQICTHGLLLERGEQKVLGSIDEVTSYYLRAQQLAGAAEVRWPAGEEGPGNDLVQLLGVRVYQAGTAQETIDISLPTVLEIEFLPRLPDLKLYPAFWLRDGDGNPVFASMTAPGLNAEQDEWFGKPLPQQPIRSRCIIPAGLLNNVNYRLSAIINRHPRDMILCEQDLITFEASHTPTGDSYAALQWFGVVRPQLAWSTEVLPND